MGMGGTAAQVGTAACRDRPPPFLHHPAWEDPVAHSSWMLGAEFQTLAQVHALRLMSDASLIQRAGHGDAITDSALQIRSSSHSSVAARTAACIRQFWLPSESHH